MTDEFDAELAAERYIRYTFEEGMLDVDRLADFLDDGQDAYAWHQQTEAVGSLLSSGRFLIDWDYS